MQQVVIIEQGEFNKLLQSIEDLKQLILNRHTQPAKKTKTDQILEEIEQYVPLKVALNKLGITSSTWHDNHKHFIQWKKDGKRVWVYLPSINKYLKQDNVND